MADDSSCGVEMKLYTSKSHHTSIRVGVVAHTYSLFVYFSLFHSFLFIRFVQSISAEEEVIRKKHFRKIFHRISSSGKNVSHNFFASNSQMTFGSVHHLTLLHFKSNKYNILTLFFFHSCVEQSEAATISLKSTPIVEAKFLSSFFCVFILLRIKLTRNCL